MAKPPRGRHSKPARDPVTIDLEAEKTGAPKDDAGTTGAGAATSPAGDAPSSSASAVATGKAEGAAAARPGQADADMPTAGAAASAPGTAGPGKDEPKAKENSTSDSAGAAKSSVTGSGATQGVAAPAAGAADPTKGDPISKTSSSDSSSAIKSPTSGSGTTPSASASASMAGNGDPGKGDPKAKPGSSSDSSSAVRPPLTGSGTAQAGSGTQGAAAPRSAPPAGTRQSRGGGLVGGIAGGGIVLAGVLGLHWAGIWPADDSGQDDRVAALEAEIGDLRQTLAGLQDSGEDDAVSGRIDGLEGDLAGLRENLGVLQTELAELSGSEPEQVDLSGFEERIAALEDNIAQLEGADTQERLAALEETSQNRMNEVEQRLDGLAQRIEEQAGAADAALVIAASSLQAAVERGNAFAGELATLEQLAPQTDGLEDLRSYADSGVAPRSRLVAEVDQAANAMIQADRSTADPNAGFMERLFSSAEGLVAVRPVGEVEGDDVPAIVARIEAAVRGDDYGRAVTEYENLPEASQEAGREFMDQVRARHAADELVSRVMADAMSESE